MFFEAFSKSKNEYCGEINSDSFELRRKRKFLDPHPNLSTAKGYISGDNKKTVIHTEINGLSTILILPFILIIVFSMVTAFSSNIALLLIPILSIIFLLVITLLYFTIRRSIEKFKYDLEREFFI